MPKKIILVCCIFALFLSACQSSSDLPAVSTPQPAAAQATATPFIAPSTEWIAPAIPDALRQAGLASGLTLVDNATAASARLEIAQFIDVVEGHPVFSEGQSVWFYALVAPFPTVADGVTLEEVKQAWAGNAPLVFANRPLVMTESTYGAMKSVFDGEAAAGSGTHHPG
jgi:hypothetical protein